MVRVSKQEGVFVFHVISKIRKETLEKPEYKAKNIVTRSLGRARRNVSLSPPLCRHAPESRHSNHEINVKRMNLPLVVM